MKHKLPIEFLKEPNSICVVGAGGNGAQFINGLARMVLSLRALGHPGFSVSLFDNDLVSEANIGRQLYSTSDIGTPKAIVLVNRINAYYGLNFQAIPTKWVAHGPHSHPAEPYVSLIVGCVDSNAARRDIEYAVARGSHRYWLDMGNSTRSGQVVLGESRSFYRDRIRKVESNRDTEGEVTPFDGPRLPTVLDLFPDMRNARIPEDLTPSCSLAGALEKQDLFINQLLSTWALHLLWTFYRSGALEHHGYFINAERGISTPLPVDPVGWDRMGFHANGIAPLRKIKKVIQRIRPFHPGRFKLVCGHIAEGHGRYRIRCVECQLEGKK